MSNTDPTKFVTKREALIGIITIFLVGFVLYLVKPTIIDGLFDSDYESHGSRFLAWRSLVEDKLYKLDRDVVRLEAEVHAIKQKLKLNTGDAGPTGLSGQSAEALLPWRSFVENNIDSLSRRLYIVEREIALIKTKTDRPKGAVEETTKTH